MYAGQHATQCQNDSSKPILLSYLRIQSYPLKVDLWRIIHCINCSIIQINIMSTFSRHLVTCYTLMNVIYNFYFECLSGALKQMKVLGPLKSMLTCLQNQRRLNGNLDTINS